MIFLNIVVRPSKTVCGSFFLSLPFLHTRELLKIHRYLKPKQKNRKNEHTHTQIISKLNYFRFIRRLKKCIRKIEHCGRFIIRADARVTVRNIIRNTDNNQNAEYEIGREKN